MVLKLHTSYFFRNQMTPLSIQETNHLRIINSEQAIRRKVFLVMPSRWFHFQYLLLLKQFCLAICFYYQIKTKEKGFRGQANWQWSISVCRTRKCSWIYLYTFKNEKFNLRIHIRILIYSRENFHIGIQVTLYYQLVF